MKTYKIYKIIKIERYFYIKAKSLNELKPNIDKGWKIKEIKNDKKKMHSV